MTKVIETEKFIELIWHKKIKTIFRNKFKLSSLEFKWYLKVSNRDKWITVLINNKLSHLGQATLEQVSITKIVQPQSMNEQVINLFPKIERKLKPTVSTVSQPMVRKRHTQTTSNPVFQICTTEKVVTTGCPAIQEEALISWKNRLNWVKTITQEITTSNSVAKASATTPPDLQEMRTCSWYQETMSWTEEVTIMHRSWMIKCTAINSN